MTKGFAGRLYNFCPPPAGDVFTDNTIISIDAHPEADLRIGAARRIGDTKARWIGRHVLDLDLKDCEFYPLDLRRIGHKVPCLISCNGS